MRIIDFREPGFEDSISAIIERDEEDYPDIEKTVKRIINDIKEGGDHALIDYTERFDGVRLNSISIPQDRLSEATKEIPERLLRALKTSAERIEAFHRRNIPRSWSYKEDGILLGQKVTPLQRVGIYVPGGKALYPSSILMNAIPAKVAGVEEVVMVTPPSKDGIDPSLLAAASIAGVDRVYQVGGAQAIAALAYGTETIPVVDKIVGPGNIYVATAKRLVFGQVDIDMVAGPSEILIINDGSGEPEYIAADLLSQAEHDEMALCILITTSRDMAETVDREVSIRLSGLDRKEIASLAIERRGAIIIVNDLKEAVELSNSIAPEHLELFVKEPSDLIDDVRNAGAIFLGYTTPEPIGDYIAGPNHVLPTGGTARFSSPLGVEDFLKRSSIISFEFNALKRLGEDAMVIARKEGLDAHAGSIAVRLGDNN